MGLEQPIDITAEQRKTVLTLLKRHLPNTTAWVYVSRTKWTASPQSDLDMVVFATPEQSGCVSDLRRAFEESDLLFRVDLFVWDAVPEQFREQIQADHAVLVEREKLCMAGEWHQTVYGRFSSDFVDDLLVNLCDQVNGVQTGPFGSQLHKKDYVLSGTPIVTVEHLGNNRIIHKDLPYVSDHDRERLSKYSLRTGDIVFSRVGSVDRRALVREPENGWLFSGRCLRVRADPRKIDSAYLSYFFGLPSFKEHVRAIAVGATMPSLNTQILSDIVLPHPCDLNKQRAIAHILGTLDDKIELNRRMNETLEAMARALFKSWFVDFDPVRAKMEGSDTGLPQRTANLFPSRMVDSELGAVPEGWKAATLGDIASLNPESWKSSNPPHTVTYVDLASAKWGYLDKVKSYTWEKAPSRARRVLRKHDTIVATVRPGNGSFALIGTNGLTGSTGFAVLRPQKTFDRELVWCAATSLDNIERLAHLADGGAYPAVRPNAVLATPIVLANRCVRKAFAKFTGVILDRIEEYKYESRALAGMRDTLLPKLVSGQIQANVAELTKVIV